MTRRLGVVAVVLLAVVRVVLAVGNEAAAPERALANDSIGYLEPARALVEDGRYVQAPGSDTPEFLRTPGYPVFLAAAFTVVDDNGFAVGVQAAASVLAVVLTYLTARRLGLDQPWSAVAAGVVALDPFQNATAGLVMTESFATVLTAATAYAGVRLVQDLSVRWALATGIAVVASTFVRPVTVYLPLVLVVVVLAIGLRSGAARRAAVAGALVLAVTVPAIGGWYLRNHHHFGTWTFTSSEAGTLYWYRAAGLVAEQQGIPWDPDARVLLTQRLNPGMSAEEAYEYRIGGAPPSYRGREGEYYELARDEAIEILGDDLVGTARQAIRGVYSQAVSSGWTSAAEVFGVSLPGPIRAVGVLVNGAVVALAAVGALLSLRGARRRGRVVLLVLAVYSVALNAGYQAVAGHRFRAPIWPVVAVFAAIGAQRLWQAIAARRSEAGDRGAPLVDRSASRPLNA